MDLIGVRQLTEEDWQSDREMVLRSIEDTPWAYKMTYQEAEARTEQDWRNEIKRWSSTFVAMRDNHPIGQIAAVYSQERPGVTELMAVWVAPDARGSGAADQLMRTQLDWLQENGKDQVILWTSGDNFPMQHLGERHGFTRTGNSKPNPGHAIPAVEMGRNLT